MATIHLKLTTTATPEQFVAALTHFGPGREKLFASSADSFLTVHDQGPNQADVTEGSNTFWERLRYDWSDPRRVVLTTIDSNVWGRASGYTFTLTRETAETTSIDAVIVREGRNFKGRTIEVVVFQFFGERFLGSRLGKTVKAIEAWSAESANA
jgi:hypothetical protein